MPPKKFSKDYQPAKRRGRAKKSQVEVWGEMLASYTKSEREHIKDAALRHACGDVIITESHDGEKLTAKCVSNPTLFLGLLRLVSDAEQEANKKPQALFIPVPDDIRAKLQSYKHPGANSATA